MVLPSAKFPVQPLQDRVIVLRDEAQEKSGILYIPDSAKRNTKTGKVMAVGPGKATETGTLKPQVKVGDHVFFSEYAGVELVIGTVKYSVMKEEEISGVFVAQAASGSSVGGAINVGSPLGAAKEGLPLEGAVAGKAPSEERQLKLAFNREDPT